MTGGLPGHADVLHGVGDDCAVLRVGEGVWLASCDASLEGVHFRRDWATPEDIGWKAAASALSDIAAMGGVPRFALVTLACPADTEAAYLARLYGGLRSAFDACGTVLIGGDTTASPQGVVLDVTVLGEAENGRYLLRSGAKAGDRLVVTGAPGFSGAGLLALERGIDAPEAIRAHQRPEPRFQEGQWLAARSEVHALIDLSDGLAADAQHIAEASNVGVDFRSDQLPIAAELAHAADLLGEDGHDLACYGGEDYELLAAVSQEAAEALCADFRRAFEAPIAIVGALEAGTPQVCLDGKPLENSGFHHFKPA